MKDPIHKIQVVSVLFIALGLIAWSRFFWTLLSDSTLVVSLEMILLPAGFGLLRRSNAWRRVTVTLVLVFMMAIVAVPLLGYSISPGFKIGFLGYSPDPISLPAVLIVLAYAGIILGCLFWLFGILRDKNVVSRFGEGQSRTPGASGGRDRTHSAPSSER